MLRKKANTTKIPVYRTITSRTKDLTIKDSLTQLVAVIITIENIKIKNTKAFVFSFLIRNENFVLYFLAKKPKEKNWKY